MTVYASNQNGNWSNTGIWTPNGVPGDGDTFTVISTHIVTIDSNVTAGLSGATGTVMGTINQGGTLVIADGGVLNARGDLVIQRGGTCIGEAGGEYIFDAPTGSQYGIKNGLGGAAGYATLQSTGTGWGGGQFFTVTGNSGRGGSNGFIDSSNTGSYPYGHIKFAYTKINALGTASIKAVNHWCTDGNLNQFHMNHVLVTNSGLILSRTGSTLDLQWNSVDFRNPIDTSRVGAIGVGGVFQFSYNSTKSGVGVRSLTDITIYSDAKYGYEISNDFFLSNIVQYNVGLAGTATNARNTIEGILGVMDTNGSFVTLPPKSGHKLLNSVFLTHIDNPHFTVELNSSGNALGGILLEGNLFDADDYFSTDTGEAITSTGTGTIQRNILIGGAGSLYGAVDVDSSVDIYNNTVIGNKTCLAATGETVGAATQLLNVKNNLMYYSTIAPAAGSIVQRSAMVPQTGFEIDYNASYGNPVGTVTYPLGHPYAGNQSYLGPATFAAWWAPAQTFGTNNATHDLVVDPGFIDSAWTVRAFFGATSVQAVAREAVTINGFDYQGNVTTATIKTPAAILAAGRAAFTPTNAALKTAGEGGTYIGAMDVQADPLVTITAPIQYAGRAKYNITRVSGASSTLADADTYSFADAHEVRVALRWEYGTDHWAFTDAGVPKVIAGSVIKSHGLGPDLYTGFDGIYLYA